MVLLQTKLKPKNLDFDKILEDLDVHIRETKYLVVNTTVKPVSSSKQIILPPYTSKVAKTLLISSNPKLDYLFTPRYNMQKPKPVSITPLMTKDGFLLWKKLKNENEDGQSTPPIQVETGAELSFRITVEEPYFDEFFNALQNIDGIEVFSAKWRLQRIDIHEVEFPVQSFINLSELKKKMVLFKIKAPVLLFDPYKYRPSVYRFLPLSGILLAYNIGAITGIFEKTPRFWLLIDIVNAVLHEHRRILRQIYGVKYVYDGKTYYGLMGTPAYYLVKNMLLSSRKLFRLVENILAHAEITGIGSGRAAGFGYTELVFY